MKTSDAAWMTKVCGVVYVNGVVVLLTNISLAPHGEHITHTQHPNIPSPFCFPHKENPPSWTLALWGRTVDAPLDALETATAANGGTAPPTAPPPPRPFTWYLQNLTIRLPPEQFGEENVISWQREHVSEEFVDRLQVKRVGNVPIEVEIVFEPYSGLALQSYVVGVVVWGVVV